MSRPLFFYSFFPLGFFNVEAERKAYALRDAGWDVLHVTAPLIRNPRPAEARKVLEHLRLRLRERGGAAQSASELRSTTLAFVPPRQLGAARMVNAAWTARQLSHALGTTEPPVAWVRWPTPEVVAALPRLRPRAIVYECVDAYWETPGVVGRWRDVYHDAERELVRRADVVVVPSEPLADRFEAFGASVELIPHGADVPPETPTRRSRNRVTIGFVGTLDYRLMLPVLRRVAEAHPEWHVRLIGPITEGFDRSAFDGLPNVSVEPPIAHDRVPDTLAEFDLGIMPYDHPTYPWSCAVKNLEYFAAGIPAVATPSPSLERFAHLLYLATTPDEFVRQLERALAEDSPELRRARRAAAEENTWERRLAEVVALVDRVAG